MASIRKRGDSYTITAYFGYDEQGRQIKKTTTFNPPNDVTAGKAEKLAREYGVIWEQKIKGYVNLDENARFSELAEWYFETVAPTVLKPNILQGNKYLLDTFIMPSLGREKVKNISPVLLDNIFTELLNNGRVISNVKLKDGAKIDVDAVTLGKQCGVSQLTILRLKRGHNIRKENAEKIAAALDVAFDTPFVSGIENRQLTSRTVQRIKNVVSAIFTAAVKKRVGDAFPRSPLNEYKHKHTSRVIS